MSLAATNMRGSFLNWRFAVNGIQKARRSLGVTLRFDIQFSMALPRASPGLMIWFLYLPVKLSVRLEASSLCLGRSFGINSVTWKRPSLKKLNLFAPECGRAYPKRLQDDDLANWRGLRGPCCAGPASCAGARGRNDRGRCFRQGQRWFLGKR